MHYRHWQPLLRRAMVCLLLILHLLGRPSALQAGSNVWTPLGPEGGAIYSLAVDPTTHDTIYAGTRSGIYKSTNGGGQWVAINQGLADNQLYLDVYAIQIDPKAANVLYAATINGVFKSINSGETWTATPKFHRTEALVIDPQNSSILYATWSFGVYKSTDAGATWHEQSTGLNDNLVVALAIDPKTPTTLYAGTYGGLFKSVDSGASWSEVAIDAATDKRVMDIVINSESTTTLYLAMTEGVFKSSNGGSTWSNVLSSSPQRLTIDPTKPTTLYATTFGGVYKSSNSGSSWSRTDANIVGGASILVVDPAAPTTLYVGTYSTGIYKSVNGGGVWATSNGGLYNSSINQILIHPQTPAHLYLLAAGSLLYKSVDSGLHWELMSPEFRFGDNQQTGRITTLILHPQTPSTLYAGTDAGPFKSIDGGVTWQWLYSCSFFCFLPYVSALAIDPTAPGTVYMASAKTLFTAAGFSRSDDGGDSWTYAGEGLPDADVNVIVVDPQNSARVYVGTEQGFYVTTNKGDLWTLTGTGLPAGSEVQTLVIDPSNTKRLFAGVAGGIYQSADQGANWQNVVSVSMQAAVNALVLDPLQPLRLYATDNRGVINSSDGGTSWGTLNNGLPKSSVYALAIDPARPNTLYAGTSNHGVYIQQIIPVPQITTQPASQRIENQQSVTLTVVATDDQALTYQWYQGSSGDTSTPIPGATSASFNTPPLAATTNYWVRITNTAGGTVDSETAIITVNTVQPLVILVQPRNQSITLGQSGTISVTANGIAPLTYQWYQGNRSDTKSPIANATGSSYTTPPLSVTTTYWVQVSNVQGTLDSAAATITVTAVSNYRVLLPAVHKAP